MALSDLWRRFVAGVYRYLLEPAGLRPSDIEWLLDRFPRFLLILLIFYVFTRGVIWLLDRTILSPRRVDPMLRSVTDRLVFASLMLVGFSVGLRVFGVNILDLALAFGLVGAGLALGLQNTVANIMGGISLASDRPFEVGDRIQIGEFWGDVEEIGLRSTRILTARREYVVVPNRLMDEREIWNYTKRYPELRLEVHAQISYDSDVDRAKRLMKTVARRSEDVLSFPRPEVLVTGFEDSGVGLDLWCHIEDARERYRIAADLRAGVKNAFDENGVEIPYPYRTLVDKKDLPEPARDRDPGEESQPLGDRRLLVTTAGATPAMRKADTIVSIAKRLDADIVLAYITPRSSIVSEREGEKAADIFQACADRHDVGLRLVIEEGDIVDSIRRVARREGCGAVVIGGSRTPVLMAWKRADVEDRLRRAVDIPLIVVPPSLELDESEVQAAKQALDERAPPDEHGPGEGTLP